MEKGKKLKNYSDKNYTEIIGFPVELVGRDGVVRRYSYEDSIRIYRRRIDSAHVRYQDREIINAEIFHCTRRMEQIQRSWGQRIRRSEQRYIDRRPDPDQRQPYEQGKAFLQAYLGGLVGARDLTPNLVLLTEIPPCRVFYVNHSGFRAGTLLYVFDFTQGDDSDSDSDGVRHYEDYLQLLLHAGEAPDIEKLIHSERSSTSGFLLTNPNPELLVQVGHGERDPGSSHDGDDGDVPLTDRFSFLSWIDSVLQDGQSNDSPVLREIMEAIGTGDLELAYQRCRKATEDSAYNRQAYWMMGALSEILGYWKDTQPYLAMALHYFPDDPRTLLLIGLHELRLGSNQQAVKSLEAAHRIKVDLPCLHALLARAYVSVREQERAKRFLKEGLKLFPDDDELKGLDQLFRAREKWYKQALVASLIVTFTAMAATYDTTSNAISAVGFSLLGLGIVYGWYRRKMKEWNSMFER